MSDEMKQLHDRLDRLEQRLDHSDWHDFMSDPTRWQFLQDGEWIFAESGAPEGDFVALLRSAEYRRQVPVTG